MSNKTLQLRFHDIFNCQTMFVLILPSCAVVTLFRTIPGTSFRKPELCSICQGNSYSKENGDESADLES